MIVRFENLSKNKIRFENKQNVLQFILNCYSRLWCRDGTLHFRLRYTKFNKNFVFYLFCSIGIKLQIKCKINFDVMMDKGEKL